MSPSELIMKYISEVIRWILLFVSGLLTIITLVCFVMWEIPSIERFWTDGAKTMLRIIVFFSIVLPMFFRFRITIKEGLL